jgi:hypothetical protein
MKTLYNYILEGSLLDDIDDILADGDEIAEKKEIVDWLKDNFDFVIYAGNIKENEDLWKNPKNLNLNSKGEINIRDFRPYYSYAEKPNKFLDLPVPEYIKFDNVKEYSIVGTKSELLKIDMNKLPHINSCNYVFLRNWANNRDTMYPDLSKLNIDNIVRLTVDIQYTHPNKWPKTKISTTHLLSNTVINYDEEYLESCGYNYNLHDLKGLKTNELLIPDYLITEKNDLIGSRSKKDILINRDEKPYEWQNLNIVFETKSFDKLYIYKTTFGNGGDTSYAVKKVGNDFVIKGRGSHIFNKYYDL